MAMRFKMHVPVYVAIVIMWIASGSTFAAFKIAVEYAPPLVIVSARLLLASLLLMPFCVHQWRIAPPTAVQIRNMAVAATLCLVVGQTAIVSSLRVMPTGLASILSSSSPLFLLLILRFVCHEPVGRQQYAGIVLGFVGLVLLVASRSYVLSAQVEGIVILFLGALSWAAGSAYQRVANMPSSDVIGLTMQMFFAGGVLFAISLLLGDFSRIAPVHLTSRFYLAVVYLSVVGSIVAFGLYTWLNRHVSALVSNTFSYTSPVFAFLIGVLVLREPVSWAEAAFAILPLIGVALTVTGQSMPTDRSRPQPGRLGTARLVAADGSQSISIRQSATATGKRRFASQFAISDDQLDPSE